MKIFKSYILICIFLFASNISYSQNIVYANLDNIMKTSNVGKKIISYFSDKNNKLINEFKNKQKVISENEKSLISQKNILQAEEYSKKVAQINEDIKNFNQDHNKKIKQIKDEREQVLKSFQIEINKILKEFAEQNNIDIIMSSNQMLIGKSNLDVTSKLLKIVNEKIKNFKIN